MSTAPAASSAPPTYENSVWTTPGHGYTDSQAPGYQEQLPPPYNPDFPPQQQQDVEKTFNFPYAAPPLPGYYAPLPTGAPPPYEAAVNDMYGTVPDGQSTYLPPLQQQPISMQPGYAEQAALVAVESGKSMQKCQTCCKVTLSLIAHLGFFACLGSLIYHLATLYSVYDVALVFGLSAGFLVLAYLLILCEVSCSDTRKYVSNVLKEGNLLQFVSELRRTRPNISWYLECYHYETRTRTVTSTDGNGRTTTRTETYQERVVTHRETLEYQFSQWRDVSPPPPVLTRGVASRIAMYKTYTFANDESRQNYTTQKDSFYLRNVRRDVHMDFHENFSIMGFKERLTAYIDDQSRKLCMTHGWYWLSSALICTWPYRYWFRRVTNKAHYCLIKEFGM